MHQPYIYIVIPSKSKYVINVISVMNVTFFLAIFSREVQPFILSRREIGQKPFCAINC